MKLMIYIITAAFTAVMFICSWIVGEKAVIMPEMLMLVTGLICTEKLPWKTDGVRTVLFITVSAFIGYFIASKFMLPLYIQAVIALAASGILLIITDCPLMPCVSVCLMPVYMGYTTIAYPAAAAVLSAAVVGIRTVMIKNGIRESAIKFHYTPNFDRELVIWLKIFIVFAVISLYPLISGKSSLFVPAMAAVLAESFHRDLTGRRVNIWFVITAASIIGALAEFACCELLGLPAWIAAAAAVALTLLEMQLMGMPFPQILAFTVLAFVIDENVFNYPVQVSLSCATVMIVSIFIGKQSKRRKMKHG